MLLPVFGVILEASFFFTQWFIQSPKPGIRFPWSPIVPAAPEQPHCHTLLHPSSVFPCLFYCHGSLVTNLFHTEKHYNEFLIIMLPVSSEDI